MSNNPLSRLYRQKNIYVDLPSRGKFYTSGISLSVDNELGIMPMTVKDEIVLKTPDSLFNGNALIDLIESCVPDIKNPEETPICDLDSIILGIRAATDQYMEMDITCPNCNETEIYKLDLYQHISTIKKIPDNNTISLEDGNVIIEIRPYTLKTLSKKKIQEHHFQKLQKKLMNTSKKINDENEEEITKQIKDSFEKAYKETTELTIDIVSESIISVKLKDISVTVDSTDKIREWVYNMDKNTYKMIITKISELNDNNIQKTIDVQCSKCSHQYKSNLELNPVNFFTTGQSN